MSKTARFMLSKYVHQIEYPMNRPSACNNAADPPKLDTIFKNWARKKKNSPIAMRTIKEKRSCMKPLACRKFHSHPATLG